MLIRVSCVNKGGVDVNVMEVLVEVLLGVFLNVISVGLSCFWYIEVVVLNV